MTSNKLDKIYFVLGSFKGGGTERTASRLGLELIGRGFDVKFLLINGIFDYDNPLLIENSIILSKGYEKSRFKFLFVFFNLLKTVWRAKPKRLISFSLGINLLIFFLFYPNTVFRVESNIFIYRKKRYRRYLQRIFSVFPHIRYVIIPSKGLADACREYFYAKNKVIHLDNPIDFEIIDQFKEVALDYTLPHLKRKYIISAGRLSRSKGFEQLIRIFYQSNLYPEYNLLVLGKGEQHHELQEVIRDLSIQENVFLLGHKINPYKYFYKSEFFILNSSHESFGNVLIEALACGVPVLSNDCDFGPRHILIEGVNGRLYDKNNEKEFLHSMNEFSKDSVFNSMKTNAIESVKKFDVHNITKIWIDKIICN
jgi:glycosyltransferase involved in cell wall biosynthesis